MNRICLRVYFKPSYVEGFLNIRAHDGYERIPVTIDTGAAVSLLPIGFLDRILYRPSQESQVKLEQAGIAKQSFEATEAIISCFMEDWLGNRSEEFEMLAWFAETSENLLGFEDVLDQATLYADMLGTRQAWIEFK